jgi:hypothetical protein
VNLNRRSFFAALLAPVAAAFIPSLAPPVQTLGLSELTMDLDDFRVRFLMPHLSGLEASIKEALIDQYEHLSGVGWDVRPMRIHFDPRRLPD